MVVCWQHRCHMVYNHSLHRKVFTFCTPMMACSNRATKYFTRHFFLLSSFFCLLRKNFFDVHCDRAKKDLRKRGWRKAASKNYKGLVNKRSTHPQGRTYGRHAIGTESIRSPERTLLKQAFSDGRYTANFDRRLPRIFLKLILFFYTSEIFQILYFTGLGLKKVSTQPRCKRATLALACVRTARARITREVSKNLSSLEL